MATTILLLQLSLALSLARDPDEYKNTMQVIAEHGYPVEEHSVTTLDGYILTLFRIPYGLERQPSGIQRPPVLLQHALLCSSFDYVNNAPNESLGFVLADAGFDVWLGNNRGNQWGRQHVNLTVDSEAFWDFR